MTLDPDRCYRAVSARDLRFDGHFFTGVRSTGVYCRPICPARTPQRRNCVFFVCAAAAETAGFRACLRCRPESAPGTPVWHGTSSTVSRALRLIDQGAMRCGGVQQVARRVGVGPRHLRRLFLEHVGASPQAVEQTRRIHLARRMIEETALPMAQIARAVGFGSVRRFNAAMRTSFGRPPRELRDRRPVAEPGRGRIELRIPFRPPLNWNALLAFLELRAIPGVERVAGDRYERTFEIGTARGILRVRMDERSTPARLRLDLPVSCSGVLETLVERTRRAFDLDADCAEIESCLAADPLLAAHVADNSGLRVPGAWDRFEVVVRAVLGQQVSVAAATTMAGRVARSWGRRLDEAADPDLARIFPGPRELRDAPLESVGVIGSRARCIRALACAFEETPVGTTDDVDEFVRLLVGITGIGDWTAQYAAMRALGAPDAFPAADLGLRRALGNRRGLAAAGVVATRAERWRPWRAYAAVHLWHGET